MTEIEVYSGDGVATWYMEQKINPAQSPSEALVKTVNKCELPEIFSNTIILYEYVCCNYTHTHIHTHIHTHTQTYIIIIIIFY